MCNTMATRRFQGRARQRKCLAVLSGLALICAGPCPGADSHDPVFNAVDGTGQGFLVAVGDHGMITHFLAGQPARAVPSNTDRDLLDVFVGARDFAVAVGAGVVLSWNGEAWSRLDVGDEHARYTLAWVSPDQGLVLYGGEAEDGFRICPLLRGAVSQPFCRRFDAPVLGACGTREAIYLLLANGDVHRLNNALIGRDGGFEPVYRPPDALELKAAWLPDQACLEAKGIPEAWAVNRHGDLTHFDGKDWQATRRYPDRVAAARLGFELPTSGTSAALAALAPNSPLVMHDESHPDTGTRP